jgi:hypothetical protein
VDAKDQAFSTSERIAPMAEDVQWTQKSKRVSTSERVTVTFGSGLTKRVYAPAMVRQPDMPQVLALKWMELVPIALAGKATDQSPPTYQSAAQAKARSQLASLLEARPKC